MIFLLALAACAAIHLPPPPPPPAPNELPQDLQDIAAVFSEAAAPCALPFVGWSAPGPCVVVYARCRVARPPGRPARWVHDRHLPSTVRCGPQWATVEDIQDLYQRFRESP